MGPKVRPRGQIGVRIAFGALILTSLIGLVLLYWAFQPADVLQIKNDPMPVRPLEVQADGGVVLVTVDFCKTSGAIGRTKVYLIGEIKGQKPEIAWPVDNTPAQCIKLDVPVSIPASVQTDTYHVVFETVYQVNPLKSQTIVFRSRSFKVINEKLQAGDAKPLP